MKHKNKPITSPIKAEVIFELKRRFKNAGFRTSISVTTSTGLKIGLHMCTFRIDRSIHDRNLRHNPFIGSKLTDIPTWEQRVEFNDIVNSVLNKFKVSGRIRSGPFTIRDGMHAFNENDWTLQKPEYIVINECPIRI